MPLAHVPRLTASDYEAIRDENKRRYGTDIGEIGPILLADRYDDRTHFIFELLQNAEDALARRVGWQGSRSVTFRLTESELRVSHFGQPFDEPDVRGICGIAKSTKDQTAIGRFGIGFKSVYALTDRPEVHSGMEDFAIESFVWPVAVPSINRDGTETVILLPLKSADKSGHDEISTGLSRLSASALLFLRQIKEIHWNVDGGRSGFYLRESNEIDAGVRRVTVIGQGRGADEVEKTWQVFSRPVTADGGHRVGHVEIAFSVAKDKGSQREYIRRVVRSPLVVFFPTVVETHLRFLVQGPYRTTPSRDNVPRDEPWNQCLVGETASLLVDALRWLRDHDFLDTTVLRCLPLDPTKFDETSMFAPVFGVTKKALSSEPLLPCFDTGYVSATRARLARTLELRKLFTPAQLTALFGESHELHWLSGDITQDRTSGLRDYLMQELGIAEVTPDAMLSKIDRPFLQAQPDAWILDFYHFLNGQTALRPRFVDLPLVRLEDGSHVPPRANGQPKAFLPGKIATGFPTVRATVCGTETAREFLQSLGLTEPDPVDDVVRNVMPKYRNNEVDVSDADYEADIRRILMAFATDSKVQQEKLIATLRETEFVVAVNAGNGAKRFAKPGEVYLATERLKELFAGVRDVLLVDDAYSSLRGEDVRELLDACGATRYLQPVAVASTFDGWQRREMRIAAGCESKSNSYPDAVEDRTLRGLDRLLALLPQLDSDRRTKKAALLWEALGELEDRRKTSVFSGTYRWFYSRPRSTTFDAAFVQELNATAWVPDTDGELRRPEIILFDSLGWKPNPFLQSKIRFKSPVLDQLAKVAGIEPGVLDLLKKHGVTSVAELVARLGLPEEPKQSDAKAGAAASQTEILAAPTPQVPNRASPEPPGSAAGDGGGHPDVGAGPGADSGQGAGPNNDPQSTGLAGSGESGGGERKPDSEGSRSFISYVATHPDKEESDPDGLDHSARMALEAKAIELIRTREPQWQPTTPNNPGFDLFEADANGKPTRWCEVKAMTRSLNDRPVGLSRTQFEHAQEHGKAYWLYIIEHAGTDRARIVRVQDPAGKARTFTFDHGWLGVADVDAEQEGREG